MTQQNFEHEVIAILPVYNEEKYLEQWFKSMMRFCSTVIAFDDGSTDSSLEILKSRLPENHILHRDENAHHLESYHHRDMYERIRELGYRPDWILCSGADEKFPEYDKFLPDLTDILDFATEKEYEIINWNHAELWMNEHWYRVDTYYSQIPFIRFYKYRPEIKFSEKQLVDHAHCVTFPLYYTGKKVRKMIVRPHQMMTLHYGFMEKERIIRRFDKMSELYLAGKFDKKFIYLNWIRGVDLRDMELKHLPKKWTGCQYCEKPEYGKEETLLPKDNKHYNLWERFKKRKDIEVL